MGLDAHILVKLKDDTPGEVWDQFEELYALDEDDEFNGYCEAAYYRKAWNFQNWISAEVAPIDYDNYSVHISKEKIKDLYFYLYNTVLDVYCGSDISDEPLNDDPYSSIYNYEDDLNKIVRNLDYIDDIIYFGSW